MNTLTTEKQKALLGVKKALGTTQKIQKLIEQDEYCPKVIQQIHASIGLLESIKRELLKGHMQHCLEHNLKNDKTKTINELLQILKIN
jgi:CsoR family transcriptional regulator, copper-sensing transcriptional repressor